MKTDELYMTVMPDRTWRFCDGSVWYDSFQDYLDSFEQRDFEADLWREAGRKPDAVCTITSGGETKTIEIFH